MIAFKSNCNGALLRAFEEPPAGERGVLQLRLPTAETDMRLVPLVVAPLLLGGSSALGQDSQLGQDSIACTYDACALRLEGRHVLRSRAGHRVLSLGMWGASPLTPFASLSDSGARYASEFDRHYTPGARWVTVGSLGIAVVGTLLGLRDDLPELSDREGLMYLGGITISLGLFTYGDRRVDRAIGALSRAIWWTNRDLPR